MIVESAASSAVEICISNIPRDLSGIATPSNVTFDDSIPSPLVAFVCSVIFNLQLYIVFYMHTCPYLEEIKCLFIFWPTDLHLI